MYRPIVQVGAVVALGYCIVCHCVALSPFYPPQITLEQIRSRIAQCPTSHPRLFTNKAELSSLASSIEGDPLRKQLAELIIHQATLLKSERPIERTLVGRRMLGVSRQALERVLTLAMAYHLTHD